MQVLENLVFGMWEAIIILAAILIIFGPKNIPKLAKSLGDAIRIYRKASEEGEEEEEGKSKKVDVEEKNLFKVAEELGIDTEGKSKEEIAEAITKKLGEKKEEKKE